MAIFTVKPKKNCGCFLLVLKILIHRQCPLFSLYSSSSLLRCRYFISTEMLLKNTIAEVEAH
ncbi:hypothetical protein KSS87_003543 [Heliosperma pusillum]|nr:hypothetical protein KSS87_003543 [Heliosperma pusillum]